MLRDAAGGGRGGAGPGPQRWRGDVARCSSLFRAHTGRRKELAKRVAHRGKFIDALLAELGVDADKCRARLVQRVQRRALVSRHAVVPQGISEDDVFS